ncbi:MAG: hypothetical protein GXY43_00645 [Clostridiaceae bacterium]|nr:hypothetical protein [Clostridiaceae bacterium]
MIEAVLRVKRISRCDKDISEVENVIIKSDLEACRKDLQNFIGSRIRLTSNGGRKRIIVHEGILDHCYPNVFTVRCTRQNNNTTPAVVSYSYVDVLTKAVEIAMVAGVSVSAG